MRISGILLAAAFGVTSTLMPNAASAQDKVLKIGQIGVMSGPSASWGLVSRYSAEALASLINDDGGLPIGDDKYKIEIVSVDDKNDMRAAIAGIERLAYQDKVKYVIGPNVDDPTVAILPVVNKAGLFNISYGFDKKLFTAPNTNTALGMIATYQTAPVVYQYLKDKRDVKTVSFVSWNGVGGTANLEAGLDAAKKVGLEVISSDAVYELGTTDFFPVMGSVVQGKPDLIVLSGVSPAEAPLLIRAARELGYQGIMSTETAQDAKVLEEVAGTAADGFISIGGASAPELASEYMGKFRDRYIQVAGEWNDEAGTKVYALYMLLKTIQAAGPAVIDDVEAFKASLPQFETPNPFITDQSVKLRWVGSSWFGQPRQISVPMVINEYRDGAFKTLFVTSVE